MKKKAIEKVPYLTLPKTSRKKVVKYIAVTAFKNIASERHLFVEVYKNSRRTKNVPVIRIVITKTDFGNYFPETGAWTRQKIETDHYYNSKELLWHKERSNTWQQTLKENILLETNDFDRIKKVCDVKIWRAENWWEYIYEHENDIIYSERRRSENRRYERRRNALRDREENTPELPENLILDKANRIYFSEKHFLYYKKRGCWADITCSKCGGVSYGRWKDGIAYEAQFQKWVDEPKEGQSGTCPMCGARGEYKCQGKVRGEHSQTIHLFLGQKYKETGLVMRYIEVSKKWVLDLICGEKGPEMSGALEKLSCMEIARAYFLPDSEGQIDYHKHNPYSGEDFWDDCNLYGLANICIKAAPILTETWENMKETMFQYSAMREYANSENQVNAIDYLKRYQQTPQIEMLVKMGLTGVVKELVNGSSGIVSNANAKTPDTFLGIRKCRVHQLIERRGNVDILRTMQMEHRMGVTWTDEQMEHIAETGLRREQIEVATAYMTLQQLLNRIKKYARCEWGTRCISTEQMLKNTTTTYMDYLNMRITLGYDLTNTVYQQPRNLTAAHAKMVAESSQKEADKRLNEVKAKFPNIRKQYRNLRNRYFYEDEDILIRPARSAEEIVMEGRILHHCVGEDNYLRKHNDGETYILMLRQKKEQEMPYITVEIDKSNGRILQWYGAHDKKPDKEKIEEVLKKWQQTVQQRETELKVKQRAEIEKLGRRVKKTRIAMDSRHTAACIAG